MILTDTGPLVALLDKDDINHTTCIAAAKRLPFSSMLTTWPCFTEAIYLLGAVGGYRYQAELWKLRARERLVIHTSTNSEIDYMAVLMERYNDTPMDLADASLIATAENLLMRRIFTLDSDFRIYRLRDGSVLEVLP